MRKGIARSMLLGLLIVVVAFATMAAIFVDGGQVSNGISTVVTSITGGTGTSTSQAVSYPTGASPPSGFTEQVLQSHLQKLNNRDVAGAASDYSTAGVMVWSGTTQGLGGTYQGQGAIRLTLQTAVGSASSLSYSIQSYNASGSASNSNVAGATATLAFSGNSAILGNFNGTIDAQYVYTNSGGSWIIQQETSNYKSFSVQFAQGATTFPQWQTVGPPLPNRYSESPFKNWVYFDGGALAAAAVAAFVAALPLVVRRRNRSHRVHDV